MRIVAEIPHPELKITIFQWADKHTIQWETPHAIAAIKIPMDVMTLDEIKNNMDQLSQDIIPSMNSIQKLKADLVFTDAEEEEWPVII